jgi:hypothetical protein
MQGLLPVHIVAGGLAIVVGGIALLASKGDTLHRKSGLLWRMCFALFIAAGSFFSIRARVAKILPEPFLSAPVRALPLVLVFVAMFYWLWRVRGRVSVRAQPATSTG